MRFAMQMLPLGGGQVGESARESTSGKLALVSFPLARQLEGRVSGPRGLLTNSRSSFCKGPVPPRVVSGSVRLRPFGARRVN